MTNIFCGYLNRTLLSVLGSSRRTDEPLRHQELSVPSSTNSSD